MKIDRWRVWFSESPDSYVFVTAIDSTEAMARAASLFRGVHDGETREMIAKRDGSRAVEALVTLDFHGRIQFHRR